jgi:hypothetical protein
MTRFSKPAYCFEVNLQAAPAAAGSDLPGQIRKVRKLKSYAMFEGSN